MTNAAAPSGAASLRTDEGTDMAARKFKANRNIDFNGKLYPEGSPITLEDKDAEPLLARGAISIVDRNNDKRADKAPPKPEGEGTGEGEGAGDQVGDQPGEGQ
jgi:hypothetical protein